MPCERFAGELIDHAAGGELPSSLRAHLDGCADCREVLAGAKREMADLDRDLEKMLAAEPSVEFAARVRQRIDAEGQATPAMLPWKWAFGIAAAAIVSVAVVMAIRGRGVASVPSEAPPPSQAVRVPAPVPDGKIPPIVAATPSAPGSVERGVEKHAAAVVPPRHAAVPSEPEVLVPPDQRLAIARLIAMAREGRLSQDVPPGDLPPDVPAVDPASVAPIVVDSLQVPPVTPVVAAPGGSGNPGPRSRMAVDRSMAGL